MTSTLTTCFDFFSRHDTQRQSRTIQLHMFLEVIWQQSFPANLCHCRLQQCVGFFGQLVCRSGVSRNLPPFRWHPSAQVTSLTVVTESLRRLRAHPAVYGSHLLCNMRQLSWPRSPPAHVTTWTLSPSVRADDDDARLQLRSGACLQTSQRQTCNKLTTTPHRLQNLHLPQSQTQLNSTFLAQSSNFPSREVMTSRIQPSNSMSNVVRFFTTPPFAVTNTVSYSSKKYPQNPRTPPETPPHTRLADPSRPANTSESSTSSSSFNSVSSSSLTNLLRSQVRDCHPCHLHCSLLFTKKEGLTQVILFIFRPGSRFNRHRTRRRGRIQLVQAAQSLVHRDLGFVKRR